MIKKGCKTRTIEEIRDAGLCTGCGTCASLCPNTAIEMIKDYKSKNSIESAFRVYMSPGG